MLAGRLVRTCQYHELRRADQFAHMSLGEGLLPPSLGIQIANSDDSRRYQTI